MLCFFCMLIIFVSGIFKCYVKPSLAWSVRYFRLLEFLASLKASPVISKSNNFGLLIALQEPPSAYLMLQDS